MTIDEAIKKCNEEATRQESIANSAKHLDVGKSIFADGKAHPLMNEEGEITSEGALSVAMRVAYMVSSGVLYWMWDLSVNGGF